VATQETVTDPTKLFTDWNVTTLVLPVVAPEVTLMVAGSAVSVKVGTTSVAVTAVEAVAAMLAPVVVPEPEMFSVRTPPLPAVDVRVMVVVPVPPAVSVTVVGRAAQVPEGDPLTTVVVHPIVTVPAKPLTEATVTTLVLPVVAPAARFSVVGSGVRVKDDAVRFTVTVAAVTTVAPLVPFTTTLRTPEVPGVVVMVTVLEPVPPEVRVTGLVGAQVPAAVPLTLVTVQLIATEPTKPLVEVSVNPSVLPVVAPEVRLSVLVVGTMVKEGAVSVAVTEVEAVAAMVPPVGAPEPEIFSVSTPAAPAVDVSVTVVVFVPPAVSVTLAGEAAQVPTGDPLTTVVVQPIVTVPAKPLTEATVITLVLPVVAPAAIFSVVGSGVSVKDDAVSVTAMAEEVTTVVPLVPVTVTFNTPEVPGVVVMVNVLVPVPPEVRATGVVEAQVPAAVPLTLVTVQLTTTEPTKLFTEAKVIASVLPVVAPEMML